MPLPPAVIEDQLPLAVPPLAAPAAPARTLTTQADPAREYVTAGGWGWYTQLIQALPPYVDDLSRDFPGVYESMMLDPQVSSAVDLRRLAVLANGWTVEPAVAADDPAAAQADAIRTFCVRCLDALPRPFAEVCYELLGALAFGHVVAEQVYAVRALPGEPASRLVLADVKPKPPGAVLFVVDAYNNTLGLLATATPRGWTNGALVPVFGPDGTTIPGLIPRSKFVVCSHRPRYGDERGVSALRPAYDAWWFLQQLRPEHLKYLAQFGSPILIGFTSDTAQPIPKRDATGQPIPGTLVYPTEQMLAVLEQAHNGAALVFPGGSSVQPVQMAGDGQPFLAAIQQKQTEITKAILYQTLATNEAQHQTRAASAVHQDILGMVIREDKAALAATIRSDLFVPLVRYNFGDAAVPLAPHLQLGDTEEQDFSGKLAALAQAGYTIHRSQFPAIDADLGLAERDQAQEATDAAQAAQAAQALAGAQAQVPAQGPLAPQAPPDALAKDQANG